MSHYASHQIRNQIKHLKMSFLQVGDFSFKRVLPVPWLQRFASESGTRNRIFTPIVTLKAFIWQVLSPDGSCRKAVASVLSERLLQGLSGNTINTAKRGNVCPWNCSKKPSLSRVSRSTYRRTLLGYGTAIVFS